MRRISASGAALALLFRASLASAQAPVELGPSEPVREDNARGWERPPSTEGEDAALVIPRAIMVPPRFIVETIFWPIQHGLRAVERNAIVPKVENVVFFDEKHETGLLPTFNFSSSQGPSIGAHLFDHNLGGHDEKIDATALFGGQYAQSYQLGFTADHLFGSRVWLETRTRFEADRHLIFEGYGDAPERSNGFNLGPRQAAVETRFRENRFLNEFGLGYGFGKPGAILKIGSTVVLNHRDFDPVTDESDPSITAVYDTSKIVGFDKGVQTVEIDGNLVADLREKGGTEGNGFYFEGFGGGVPLVDGDHYGHYGAEATGYIDLYKKTRVLVIRAAHEGVAGNMEDIPFSDLPRLGGPHRLRGYDLDRFRDKTSVVTTLEYHYPIHANISGSLFVDAGHVGEDYAALMRLRDWKVGGGGGFIFRIENKILFTLDVAYGDSLQVYITTDPLRAFAHRDIQL